MEVSGKAARFIAEALQYRIEWYERELKREDLSDDERSDLTNDMYYMHAILADIVKASQSTRPG